MIKRTILAIMVLTVISMIACCAFDGARDTVSFTLTFGVRRIGKYAFSGCVGLKEVTIPDSVEEIDDYAFYGCAALKRPTIAPSVKLGRHVFAEK